ncbi:beta-xylosidase [Streptomyces zhaozhouensis]|uniref:Beta-xylosidase n=1 Tax=Streptomyces zhaozhouensis TaxID=1300267 RepID=A0A286E7G0_9ACTN|nr:glycoside hydrolase family 3 N-terminal domain-containing protein [Streptomyces zhaozhouensis]SOD66794.1 beta-xylosidase [Streptomyces zhaozhouensis]
MNHPWHDATRTPLDRARALLSELTLEEKLAQLVGLWPGSDAGGSDEADVAPLQHEINAGQPDLAELLPHGLGQLTRPFGTLPVDPTEKAKLLAEDQRRIVAAGRFGIPAVAHEECLTGFTAWQATILPTPLAWGATFHPELVERAAELIGESLRSVGIHQGLSPVLDVSRDPRWGRTEETIGEDPYLVATVATGYVRGLESAGIIATLKHFVGYSASRAARNHAPVSMGPREVADVLLPPFEMALREGGARSVMAAYNDIDGVPASADEALLVGLLREEWGFEGTVVSDYFGVSFLEVNHGVAGSPGEAAAVALAAGIDVELPAQRCYGPPLAELVRAGRVPEELVDRSVLRVLAQKAELGLLDADYRPDPAALGDGGRVDLDPPALRAVARSLAEESVVLLANDGGALPLSGEARIAVAGPLADDVAPLLGCYTFPRHVGISHPELPLGVEVPTLFAALADELPDTRLTRAATAADVAGADVCVAVVGDRSGLFGRGTSGEGCDVGDLELPDDQGALLDELVAGEVPVVVVALTGRPYALGRWADRLAGVVQAFLPGQEGARAVAGVLSGRVNPAGRLPVGVPRDTGGQPAGYLAPPLAQAGEASAVDPTALYPFGHGLSYTTFAWSEPALSAATVPTDGGTTVSVTVTNTGAREGTEVVQLYLHDPVARTVRPVNRLVGYARVPLAAGASARVDLSFHADLAGYTVAPGRRIVEPGALELRLGASVGDLRHALPLTVTGPERELGHDRRLRCPATVTPLPAPPTAP